ncbi:VirB8/TrbF family protein [Nocardia sp. NPDC050712]|uniref:VirB8/TrbF family protein n=1 Tax=Nocardia sp. NPDC050712 TaxID=3155518 RepID=UPI0033F2BECF
MKDLADPDTDVGALRLAADEAQAVAEEAEAAAQEAKAVATAARARARATRLRQRAEAAATPQAQPEPSAEADETGSGTAESGPPRRRALVAAAFLMIAAAAGFAGYSGWQHHQLTENEMRAAEFTAAARQGVLALTSLDFNHAKDDVQRVLDNSAGAFHDDFRGRAEDFTKVVQQSQVTTEGKVNASAVESMTEDSAVVLVAATSRITNSAGAQQEPRVWRLSVTVSRVDGGLKISKVEFVP